MREIDSSWILNSRLNRIVTSERERERELVLGLYHHLSCRGHIRTRVRERQFLDFTVVSTAHCLLKTSERVSSWILMSSHPHRVASGRERVLGFGRHLTHCVPPVLVLPGQRLLNHSNFVTVFGIVAHYRE